MTWDGWCNPCGKVTEHVDGRCVDCVTARLVPLVAEALRRKLPVDRKLFDAVMQHVLTEMRRRV